MSPKPILSLAKTFEGVDIRTTPEGQMVAVDVLVALRVKSPSSTWRNIKVAYGKELGEITTFRFGVGRPPEVLDLNQAALVSCVSGQLSFSACEAICNAFDKLFPINYRREHDFISRLRRALAVGNICAEIDTQVPILGYKVDAVCWNAMLAIEFDEEHHRRQPQEDAKRQTQIEAATNLRFIRVACPCDLSEAANRVAGAICFEIEAKNFLTEVEIENPKNYDAAFAEIAVLRRKWLGERRIPHGDGESVPILQVTT